MAGVPYPGFQVTGLTAPKSELPVLLRSYTEPFTQLQRAQFKDASLTLAGDNYPRNAEISCDLPLYFTEKYNADETVSGITWLRTVSLQEYVTKTDDGRMLTSWTTEYPDAGQQPEEITDVFTRHKAGLQGFENSNLMMINCDFLTSNAGMLENHLKLFHKINIKQVAGGSSGNSVGSGLAGAPTSFRLKQSNDTPPKRLPEHPSKLTIKNCKIDYKYYNECCRLLDKANSRFVEKGNWQGMINLFKHLLTEAQWNMQHMQHTILREPDRTAIADWDAVLDATVNPDRIIKATRELFEFKQKPTNSYGDVLGKLDILTDRAVPNVATLKCHHCQAVNNINLKGY